MSTNTISVGICAHNEEETIGTLLDQIQEEDININEIIVIASGYDATKDIVRRKADRYSNIKLIEEKERRGQSAAQNTILQEASGNLLLLVDGDGTLEPGSLEKLVDRYDGSSILYGREIPATHDNFTGAVIQTFWQLHHDLSRKHPKYTTQIALLPADVLNSIPAVIVNDDEYMGWKAQQQGYDIEYVPTAIKHHNIKGDIKSFIRHRRKNWAGMFQMRQIRGETLQSTPLKLRFYAQQLIKRPLSQKLYLLIVGIIEAISFIGGLIDSMRGEWPYIWER